MALLHKTYPLTQGEAVRWLSIVGIGEGGVEALTPQARMLISQAELVVGGKRHLNLAADLIGGEKKSWPSPPHDLIPELLDWQNRLVCVLTSGDPFHYGMGAVLAYYVPPEQMRVVSSPSIFSLVAARTGWALQEVMQIGLNGRALEKIIPLLQPRARIIALCADETTPALLAALLRERGFGATKVTLMEHLGGPNERVRETTADAFAFTDISRLNCMAIELPFDAQTISRALPRASGIDDALFESDGMLTKREVRAVTLSALAPRRGELLWDIGLGAGSVAIEWLLADPANLAIGIEHDAERAARARRNAFALGVPDLRIIVGEAPEALEGLEAPDAIFIGGGASAPGMIEAAWAALKPGGRLVVNAISLETEAMLLAAQKQYGGALIRIGIERAEAVGTMTGWRPAMTVTQWSVTK